MPLEPFAKFFPEVAQDEIRAFFVPPGTACDDDFVPPGEYAFFEWYCTEPFCDCRRVLIHAVEKNRGIMASIGYGFDSEPIELFEDLPNPLLDPMSPQTEYSQNILEFFETVALSDEYKARLERHYNMVKEVVDARSAAHKDGQWPTSALSADFEAAARSQKSRTERARKLRKQQEASRRRNRSR